MSHTNQPYTITLARGSRKLWTVGSGIGMDIIQTANGGGLGPISEKGIYMDMLEFKLSRTPGTNAHKSMNGLLYLILAAPQEEPFSKGLLPFIISYFGNQNKKKIAELATPKALLEWMDKSPVEVLKMIDCYIPPTRSEEEMKKAYEKYEADDLDVGTKAAKTPTPRT